MSTPQRSNVLHIFVDQMRADAIHALGAAHIRTPNLDQLCREGTAFANAFSPSPVCIPARCSMIFGQYPQQTGCYENTAMPDDGRATFMETLSRAGYRTHGIGKCHFSPEANALRGFQSRQTQEEIRSHREEDDYLQELAAEGWQHVTDPHGVRGEMYYLPQPSMLPQSVHPTQWVGDQSVRFLREEGRQSAPWYLFASFVHPHPPFAPPAPWHKLYRPTDVPLPSVPPDTESLLTYVNRVQNRYKYRDQGWDLNVVRTMRAYYFACISFMDFQVGRMLDTLDELGLTENTLVLFASDHGEYLGDYGAFGKRGMHDAASRVPLVARHPGRFDAGARVGEPVSLVDLAPTVCSAAQVEPDSHPYDGVPLQEVARGGSERSYVFSQLAYTPEVDALCFGRFESKGTGSDEERAACSTYMAVSREVKYIYSAPDAMELLFDRRTDPAESRNRAHAPGYEALRDKLKAALIRYLQACGETAGLAGNDWRAFPTKALPQDPDSGLLQQDHPWADLHIEGYTERRERHTTPYGAQ